MHYMRINIHVTRKVEVVKLATANKKHSKITCSVVGARGYAGLETARLLLAHPEVDLVCCFATSTFNLAETLTSSKAKNVKCYLDSEIMNHLTDVIFLATPAEVSLSLAPQLVAAGKKVIDLSGAFRLQRHDYKKWYGFNHTEKESLMAAEYGLVPWVGPTKNKTLIANPGCFATAVAMALIPVVKSHLISLDSIVIDAKSGTTGGGKKAAENLLFSEVSSECLPYKIGCHQHYPEIIETVKTFTNENIEAHFVTSLLPVRRGIIAGIYAQLKQGVALEQVKKAFTESYLDYPLVEHAAVHAQSSLLQLKKVVGTGKTHISYEVVGDRLYLFSCIDNLLKGAGSQAIENFNRISDFPLTTGLNHLEVIT